MLLLYIASLFLSFYLLYFVSEHYFIPALDKIGERLKMTSDISGATLMAAGSSAPELAVVIVSVVKAGNHVAIGVGTIVGSALFNLFIITGVAMIIKNKAKLIWQPLARDLLFYAISVILLVWFFADGSINITEALIFVGGYGIYILAIYGLKRFSSYEGDEQINESNQEDGNKIDNAIKKVISFTGDNLPNKLKNLYVIFLLSITAISLLSWMMVTSAINISEILKIPEVVIALTVVALGTSVPDLVSSAIVAKQGRAGMAINNAIGSNIFDILIGLGLPLLLLHILSGGQITVAPDNLNTAFIFLMSSIVVITVSFILVKWQTSRLFGWMLILLYITYLIFEIVNVL
jgi:K+-dependent Na+/Ca+ exchanger-like protein